MNRYDFYNNLELFHKTKEIIQQEEQEKIQEDLSELKHYGTLGQKWGVRKWQNYDGTFNEAGKERYFGKSSQTTSTEEDKVGSARSDVKEYLKFRNKMLKKRTRDDLNKWYRDNNKAADKQLLKDAKRVDKQREKMYKNQLKDFYDDPNELVSDLDRIYKIGGEAREINKTPKSKKEINDAINQRKDEMLNEENEDMLIGASPEKKAYKAKVKELKQQAKEMGIPFGERGHLAKYCAKNGIDEITDKIVEGHMAGDKLWSDSIELDSTTNQIDRFIKWSNRGDHVREDKNVKEFTENNKNFKDFQKNIEKMNKVLEDSNKELINKIKKAGVDVSPALVDSGIGDYKTVNLKYFPENSKEYQIVDKAFQEVYKGRLKTEYKNYAKEARASLGHFEKDCHDFAKDYLVDQAEYDDPYEYALTYEKDTGKTRSTKLYETYGYLMTEPYWNEVGGA